MRRYARPAGAVVLTVGLLAIFLRQADVGQVTAEIRRARLDLLLAALAVTAVTYVLRAYRWQFLLRPIGSTRLSTAFRTTVIGFAATFLLPARAGEFLRPYLLARIEGLSISSTFATVILERLLDLVTVLVLFGMFLLGWSEAARSSPAFDAVQAGGLVAALGAVAALVLVFVLAGRPEAVGRMARPIERVLPTKMAAAVARVAETFAEGLAVVRRPRPLVAAVLLSFPLWLSIAAGIWFVSLAFHVSLPYMGSFLLMALLVIGIAVPTPGAVGGFHEAYRIGAVMFFGAANDQAVGAAIVLHAISFVPVTLLGIVFMAQTGLDLRGLRRLQADHRDALAEPLPLGSAPGAVDAYSPLDAVSSSESGGRTR